MKYPVVFPYIRTQDRGKELRYTLRSLKNVTNFNGEVYVIGDREPWYKNIIHIHAKRTTGKPYLDQTMKMRLACLIDELPDEFIAFTDDIYITEPTGIGVYNIGQLKDDRSTYHKRSKSYTKGVLAEKSFPTVDYEAHAPMLVNKIKLLHTIDFILSLPMSHMYQWRSMYGNGWAIESMFIEDKKTKTNELKQGPIISTGHYTDELDKLFPDKSRFEQ